MGQVRFFVVALVWAASLLGVGMWAQGSQSVPIASHTVISGENIGFQRSGLPPSGGTVTGRLVVKVDGQWFEAVPSK
jgi:hypothetical protein